MTALGFSALKLNYYEALSNSAFFNLRRYTAASFTKRVAEDRPYDPKKEIAHESSISPRRYTVMRSEQRRDVDSSAMLYAVGSDG